MKRVHIVIIHIVFWITFVIVPYFFMFNVGEFRFTPENQYFMVNHIINAIVFYLAYFFLLPFTLKGKSLAKMIGLILIFILAMSFLRFGVNPWIKDILGAFQRTPSTSQGKLFFYATFWTFMFTTYSVVIYLSIEWFKERRIRYELIREKQQSEIDLLKSQVNPHFLMNTLNNLYSLVYQGSKHAEDAILKLSDLMRYMLYDTQAEFVSLENEIKYLNSFIELQLLRFTHKDFIDFGIKGDPTGKLIAPMILVPFVENAFKHGNKNLQGLGIKIFMEISDHRLSFHVSNFKASRTTDKIDGSGIGLNNIKKRLELQYPGRHELEINDGPELFEVSLSIEL